MRLDWPSSIQQRFAEVDPSQQSKLDSDYQVYLVGGELPSQGEHHQVAFRVARQLNLPGVWAIDHMSPMNWDSLEDLMEKNPDDASRLNETLEEERARAEKLTASIPKMSLTDIYLHHNSDEEMARNLGLYMILAAMGRLEEFGGAEVAAGWYHRNLMIFSNLAAVTQPENRAIVVYGAGHVPLLRHFVEVAPGFRLVNPQEFLEGKY